MIKKRLTSIIFVLTTLLMLSSCREVTITSSLFCDFVSYTDRSGYFENGYVYTFRDLHDINRSDDVSGMNFLGSTITIEGLSPGGLVQGDIIRDLYIDVRGMDPFLLDRSIPVLRDGERITITSRDDQELYYFMRDAIRRFYNNGELDIMVYGRLVHNNVGVPDFRMRVTIDNLIDVSVWD